MIFYGKSLGGAVAARQSAAFNGMGLVLDSAFINGKEIASDIYPFIPWFMVSIQFPVDEDLRNTQADRIMIMHGIDDRIINIRHGRTLLEIASEINKSTFVELRGGHNDSFTTSRKLYADSWRKLLQSIK